MEKEQNLSNDQTVELTFEYIFANSFDTFKVFKNLSAEEAGANQAPGLKTIWQTLNHLILWQEHQLNTLSNIGINTQFRESASWIQETQPKNQQELDSAVEAFEKQTEQFKQEINSLKITDTFSAQRLKVVQEASGHLSFHLGEIVLLRRLSGRYPLPDQMRDFLHEV